MTRKIQVAIVSATILIAIHARARANFYTVGPGYGSNNPAPSSGPYYPVSIVSNSDLPQGQFVDNFDTGLIPLSQVVSLPDFGLHAYESTYDGGSVNADGSPYGGGPGGYYTLGLRDAYVKQVGNQVTVYAPYFQNVVFVTARDYTTDDVHLIPPPLSYFGGTDVADYQITRDLAQAGHMPNGWDFQTIDGVALLSQTYTDSNGTQYLRGVSTDILPDAQEIVTTHVFFDDHNLNPSDTEWVNMNGDLVAANSNDLLLGNFSAPILTETGQQLTGVVPVWTGLTAPYTVGTGIQSYVRADGTYNASGWTDPYTSSAAIGNLNGQGTEWINHGTQAAYDVAKLYGLTRAMAGYAPLLVYTVPEPSTFVLAILACASLFWCRNRRN